MTACIGHIVCAGAYITLGIYPYTVIGDSDLLIINDLDHDSIFGQKRG